MQILKEIILIKHFMPIYDYRLYQVSHIQQWLMQ